MSREEKFNTYIHYGMCVMGGFFGGYAILNRCDVFGSAQTANLINVILKLLKGDIVVVSIHIGALLVYISALVFAVLLSKQGKINMRYFSILIDFLALLILYYLPETMNPVIALYPVFFATAMQWSVFSGAQGYTSSSIFSTNNVKQTVTSFTSYMCDGNLESLKKAKFYAGVLIAFHFGVAISYISYCCLGIQGAIVGCLPLFAAAGLVYVQEQPVDENCQA